MTERKSPPMFPVKYDLGAGEKDPITGEVCPKNSTQIRTGMSEDAWLLGTIKSYQGDDKVWNHAIFHVVRRDIAAQLLAAEVSTTGLSTVGATEVARSVALADELLAELAK